jgi:hypothetical protein
MLKFIKVYVQTKTKNFTYFIKNNEYIYRLLNSM